jgi:hypothetical protein
MTTEQTKAPLTNDFFAAHAKDIEKILRRAVNQALVMHKHLGNPIATWKDGKVVIVPADEIVLAPIHPAHKPSTEGSSLMTGEEAEQLLTHWKEMSPPTFKEFSGLTQSGRRDLLAPVRQAKAAVGESGGHWMEKAIVWETWKVLRAKCTTQPGANEARDL